MKESCFSSPSSSLLLFSMMMMMMMLRRGAAEAQRPETESMSQCAVIVAASLRGDTASVFTPLFKSRVLSYIMASLNASHPPGVAKTPRSCPSPDFHAPSSRIARLLWDLFFFFLVLMLLKRRPLRMPASTTCLLISQAQSRRASQLRKRAIQSSFVRFHGEMIQV